MTFAERNVLSTFEFAQKIVQTKDIPRVVRMQTEGAVREVVEIEAG